MSAKKKKKSGASKKSALRGNFFYRFVTQQKPIVIILVLAFIAGFALFVQHRYEIHQEKNDLLTKQQKLEEIADRITTLHKTDDRRSERFCYSLSGFKYEKKQIGCVVDIELSYADTSLGRANQIKNEVSESLDLKIQNSGYLGANFTNNVNSENSYSSNLTGDLSECTISYSYEKASREVLRIKLSCSKSPAKAEHFPLKK